MDCLLAFYVILDLMSSFSSEWPAFGEMPRNLNVSSFRKIISSINLAYFIFGLFYLSRFSDIQP